ncbi:hypothetical protein HK103_006465 [Boothiomyces macroporosus]|uniref:GAF domain-containing protein n=1 Tax=Boothiomyces macroporosus TaxID=261099 RepID=A0AAD5UPS1_9FUNG|nr:hypothetical protein HK103_006465 [Boothiomyces macroporosus]
MTFGSMDSVAQRDSSVIQEDLSIEAQNRDSDVNIPRTANLLDSLQAAMQVSNPVENNSGKDFNIGNLNSLKADEQPSKRSEQRNYTYTSKEELSTPKLGGRNNDGLGAKVNPIDTIKSLNEGTSDKPNSDGKNESISQTTDVSPSKKGLRGPANYKAEGHSYAPKYRVNIRESKDDNHIEKVEKKRTRNRGKSEADRLGEYHLNRDMEDLLKQSDHSLHESEKVKYRAAPYSVTPHKSRARPKLEESDEEYNDQQPSSSKDYVQPQYLQDFMIQPTRQWMPMQQMMGNQQMISGQQLMNTPYGYAYYNQVDYESKQLNDIDAALPPLAPMQQKQAKSNKGKKQSDSDESKISNFDEKSMKYNEKISLKDREDGVDRMGQKTSPGTQLPVQSEMYQYSPQSQINQPTSPTSVSNNPPHGNQPQQSITSPVVPQAILSNQPELKGQASNYSQVNSSSVAIVNPPTTNALTSVNVQPGSQGLPQPSQQNNQQVSGSQIQTLQNPSNAAIYNVSAQPVPIQVPQLQQITVQQANPILPAQQQGSGPPVTQQIAQGVPPIPPQVVQTYSQIPALLMSTLSPTHTSEGSGITTSESEQLRLSAMHALGIFDASDNPRLNKITQMTAKLLGRTCCVLSLVDTDKVIWKSASYTTSVPNPIKEEARYESFCSWVVQDESGRGITILDAKSDPRCTHMRIKPGLEFYAGVPIVINGKYRIGALSIQGPPSTHISVIDMNILHEMAEWASCELDTIAQQNLLQSKEQKLDALNKLTEIKSMNIKSEREMEVRYIEKCLATIKNALKASSVLLLKLTPDSKGFDCILQAYCNSGTVNSTNLPVGEQMFHELAVLTLKKDPINQPLVLELKVGAVTKDVDHYLTKKINRVASDVVWTQGGPTGILAIFFEGQFRTVNQEDLKFIEKAMPIFSNILESLEVRDSLMQASAVHKLMGAALKKYSLPFGSHQGLAPVLLVIEPVFTVIKGFELVGNTLNQKKEKDQQLGEQFTSSSSNIAPKGQAHAQLLAKQLEVDSIMGASPKSSIEPPQMSNRNPAADILPIDCFDVLNDFSQILDVLAEKYTLKKPKRISNKYCMRKPNDVATFAHELFFSLDVYNQNKRRNIKAQIGIHCDFTPVDLAQDVSALKDQFQGMVNAAHKLELSADTILVSDIFYHQTKQICSYEAGPTIVLKGQGLFSTYKLIGKCTEVVESIETSIKENGINDRGSLILSTMPQQQTATAEPPEGAVITGKIFPEITNAFTSQSDTKKKEKKKCTIL